jgi:hypothetical protein
MFKFYLKNINLLIISIPAILIWIAWYFALWKVMSSCLMIAIVVTFVHSCVAGNKRNSISDVLSVMLFYLPLYIYSFARIYEEGGLIYSGNIIHEFYPSLYFSVVTWTTLGYGDYQPSKSVQLWAAGQAFFGYIFMAVFISIIVGIISKNKNG